MSDHQASYSMLEQIQPEIEPLEMKFVVYKFITEGKCYNPCIPELVDEFHEMQLFGSTYQMQQRSRDLLQNEASS